LGGQDEGTRRRGQAEDESRPAAGLDLLEGEAGPFIRHARRQEAPGHVLHGRDGLTELAPGAVSPEISATDTDCSGDGVGSRDCFHADEGAEGHHLAGAAVGPPGSNVETRDVVGEAGRWLRLQLDAIDPAERVEVVDVERAQKI